MANYLTKFAKNQRFIKDVIAEAISQEKDAPQPPLVFKFPDSVIGCFDDVKVEPDEDKLWALFGHFGDFLAQNINGAFDEIEADIGPGIARLDSRQVQ